MTSIRELAQRHSITLMSYVSDEFTSEHLEDESIRGILDYLCWITEVTIESGFHGGAEQAAWRRRVGEAYAALFLPPLPGHGDPYPHDVPPPRNPGVWPDVPASRVPGMTVRHQLKVIGLKAASLRDDIWIHVPQEVQKEWDERLSRARAALDHGEGLLMPEDMRTKASERAARRFRSLLSSAFRGPKLSSMARRLAPESVEFTCHLLLVSQPTLTRGNAYGA